MALSDRSMAALLRRMGRGDLTVHGFRSCFRDWCAEATAHPREVAEWALAHALPDTETARTRRVRLLRLVASCAQRVGRVVSGERAGDAP